MSPRLFRSIAALLIAFFASAGHAEDVASKLHRLTAGRQSGTVALSILSATNGDSLFGLNEESPLKPASVLKLATSLAALELLGPAYTFKTTLYADRLQGSRIGALVVRGGGDPGLATETSLLIARKLKRLGVSQIDRLVVDPGLFADARSRSGQRAYQTGASALAFNYDGIMFEVCPGRAGHAAEVSFDPFEVPLKIAGSVNTIKGDGGRVEIDEAEPLSYRFSGTIGAEEKCAILYRADPDPAASFAAVFSAQLKGLGIQIKSIEPHGAVPSKTVLLYEHQSEPLSRLIEDMNHFSSNFIAEQLLYALGSDLSKASPPSGGGWSRERGLARLQQFVAGLGVPHDQVRVVDASGLSHENRLSASAITKILLKAWRDPAVRPQFETSLSVLGESGTLKKRKMEVHGSILRAKTGTIDGVTALAGFLYGACGKVTAFSLLLNGYGFEEGRRVEEEIVPLVAEMSCP